MNQESPETPLLEEQASAPTGSRFRLQSTLFGSGLLLFGLGWGLSLLDPGNAKPGNDSAQQAHPARVIDSSNPSAITSPDGDEPAPRFRSEQIEGQWVKKGTILRSVTILPDGKAKMNVQLDYLSALLYGREMNMELSWELDDDILTHRIVGGTPKGNVDRLVRDFGDSLSYRVVKVDETELVLEDLDDERKQHHWKAVKPSVSSSAMK